MGPPWGRPPARCYRLQEGLPWDWGRGEDFTTHDLSLNWGITRDRGTDAHFAPHVGIEKAMPHLLTKGSWA